MLSGPCHKRASTLHILLVALAAIADDARAQCVFSNLPCPPTPPAAPVYRGGSTGCPSCRIANEAARQARRDAAQRADQAYKQTWQNAGEAFDRKDYQTALQYYQSARTQRPGPMVEANILLVRGLMAWYSDQQAALSYLELRRAYLRKMHGPESANLVAANEHLINLLSTFLAAQKTAATDAATRDRLVGHIPGQIAEIAARLQPALDTAGARIAAARASADYRLETIGASANADLQAELAAHPLRAVPVLPASASAELVSLAKSGNSALDAPMPDAASLTADPCAIGRQGCMESGKVASGQGFDTPGGYAPAMAIARPQSQHPLGADAIQRALDQRGIHDDRLQGLVAAYRNSELNVQTTATAIAVYQEKIDSGGPGAAMSEIYQQGLKDKLKHFADDQAKAKADVAAGLRDFGVPEPPQLAPEPGPTTPEPANHDNRAPSA